MSGIPVRAEHRKQKVTLRDVAAAAGVSVTTVSRVLNGFEHVEESLRSRVLETIRTSGYRPNPFARKLHGIGSSVIGVLVPQLANEFYGRLISAIEGRLSAHGYHILCSLGHDEEQSEIEAIDRFRDRYVDGYILLADRLPESKFRDLVRDQVAVVILNRHIADLSANCIGMDHSHGAYLMTRHLLELGHQRIGHIRGPLDLSGARKRFEGYRRAITEAGGEVVENRIAATEVTERGGMMAMRQLLQTSDVTAVFVGGDKMAVGALAELREQGVSVPDQMSIGSFDDATVAPYTAPPLTTIRYPVVELGNLACDRVLAMIAGEACTEVPLLTPDLVERRSTAPATS